MNQFKSVFFRIDPDLYKDFCEECHHRGLIKTKLMVKLIEEWLKKNKTKGNKDNDIAT